MLLCCSTRLDIRRWAEASAWGVFTETFILLFFVENKDGLAADSCGLVFRVANNNALLAAVLAKLAVIGAITVTSHRCPAPMEKCNGAQHMDLTAIDHGVVLQLSTLEDDEVPFNDGDILAFDREVGILVAVQEGDGNIFFVHGLVVLVDFSRPVNERQGNVEIRCLEKHSVEVLARLGAEPPNEGGVRLNFTLRSLGGLDALKFHLTEIFGLLFAEEVRNNLHTRNDGEMNSKGHCGR